MERGELSLSQQPEERSAEESLRPQNLEEMIGQPRLRENLSVFVQAARERDEPLDHVLFHGPPGLGKTSLARIVAAELQTQFRATSGPAIERPGDLAALLSNVEAGDVLFIDEIHRLSPAIEEILYPAMEDFQLDLLIGEGPTARSIRLDLPRFTLVGATTRAGLLTSPLRDRFGWSARLEYYPVDDLEQIVTRSGGLFGPGHMPSYCGPPPPSGGTQSMIWYGSMMSHALQCTQFDGLICNRTPSGDSTISYTPAGQKRRHGFAYSSRHRVRHTSRSWTSR